MDFTVIHPDTLYPTTSYFFSHAVRMGNLIFVSGQVAQNANNELVGRGDVRTQTEQVFENIRLILEAAGSGLDRIGKMTVFTTSLDYRPIIHEVRSKVFGAIGHYPASTLAVVTSLAQPDWLVEIEVVAQVK
jgi:enamine deaminase RidA (YjgF/YER057c/UK114 family)